MPDDKQPIKSEEVLTMEALIEIIVSDKTPKHNQIQALNKLWEIKRKDTNYFETMLDSDLSYGACPFCGHENHWLIPETELNMMGIVTAERDSRVPRYTSKEICPEFAESCIKKRVGI